MASLATPSEEKAVLPGGRRKLFVAGFPKEGVKEADIKELFEKYGKVEEIWLNMEKCFGFLKLVSGCWTVTETMWFQIGVSFERQKCLNRF